MDSLRSLSEGDLREMLDSGEISSAARERLQWLLHAAKTGKGVEDICRTFATSRTTVYRWLKRFVPGDPASLEDRSRRPKTLRQPDTEEHVIGLIERYRRTFPVMGPRAIRKKLEVDHEVRLSDSTIQRVIKRERFYFADTISHRAKRNGADRPQCGGSADGGPGIAPAAPLILLLLAVAAVASLSAPHRALASGTSASFRIDFGSLGDAGTKQGSADAFTVVSGVTNIWKSGASASFRIEPYAYISSESAAPSETAVAAVAVAVDHGGSRGGARRMAKKIAAAYEAYLKKIGRQPDGAEPLRAEESLRAEDASIVRTHRERLLATVDGRRVIYRDVPAEAWYIPYVAHVVAEGIAHGYETVSGWLTGMFGVANPVTKAESLKMSLKASGREVDGEGAPINRSASGTWVAPYVREAEELGLREYDRSVNVHAPATRAGVLRTILEAAGIPIAKQPAIYTDVPAGHQDSGVIATASFYGLVSGFPDGSFRPDEAMNRAEAAKITSLLRNMLLLSASP